MSLVPASTLSVRRTERGMRRSRSTSRSTTGSVEARIVPSSNARTTGRSSSSVPSPASSPMTSSVAGPRTRTGTSQSRRRSVSSRFTASRNSTRARATTATTSSTLLSRPIEMTWRPRSPSRNPRPRNSIGNDRGARSIRPAARAETTRTPAIRPNAVSSSNIVSSDLGSMPVGRCQHGAVPSDQPSRRRSPARNARDTDHRSGHRGCSPCGHRITRQERIIQRGLARAVLAAQVGWVVQPVRSCRAGYRQVE